MSSCQSDLDPADTPTYPENARLNRILRYINPQDQQPSTTEEYEYNPEGQLVKVLHRFYENRNEKGISQYEEYVYNNQDQLSEIASYSPHQDGGYLNLKNTRYTYNSQGLLEKETFEYPEVNIEQYNLFYYDQIERLIRKEFFNAKNQVETSQIFIYNAKGEIEEEKSYGAGQQLIRVNKNHYEKINNTQTDIFATNGNEEVQLRKIIRTFDSNHNLIAMESLELSSYSSATSFKLRFEYQK